MNKIARGRFSHSTLDDLKMLSSSIFAPIKRDLYINEIESQLAYSVGKNHGISFSYARTAIYYSLKSLSVPAGSKIIMPSITIKAILDVVIDLGFEPVFVDSDLETACFALEDLKTKLEMHDAKVCILTYLFGVMPEMTPLVELLSKHKIFVIEDFSQAFGASDENIRAGSFGDISIYSASAIKTLDTYGGGFALTSNNLLAQRLREYQSGLKYIARSSLIKKVMVSSIKNLMSKRFIFSLVLFPIFKKANLTGNSNFDRFVGKRPTSPVPTLPQEWFTRYSSIQAKFGLQVLRRIDERDRLRIQTARKYINSNKALSFVSGSQNRKHTYWQCIVIVDDVYEFRKYMYGKGIDTALSSLIEISQLPEYKIISNTPNADLIYKKGVYLPCYHHLSHYDIKRVSTALTDYSLSITN